MYFLFDCDGTLTPSRGIIDTKFKMFLIKFVEKFPSSLVSGSDYSKTIEQLGEDLVDRFIYSFNCSGNAIYQDGKLIKKTDWVLSEKPRNYLMNVLETSSYPLRVGNHLEERLGAVNFSVVGRNVTQAQREEYFAWDKIYRERAQIADYINKNFTGVEAVVGGEISIDIYSAGADKSQVLSYLKNKDIIFFGDKCMTGGNDYPLSSKLPQNKVYAVTDWRETFDILKRLYFINCKH